MNAWLQALVGHPVPEGAPLDNEKRDCALSNFLCDSPHGGRLVTVQPIRRAKAARVRAGGGVKIGYLSRLCYVLGARSRHRRQPPVLDSLRNRGNQEALIFVGSLLFQRRTAPRILKTGQILRCESGRPSGGALFLCQIDSRNAQGAVPREIVSHESVHSFQCPSADRCRASRVKVPGFPPVEVGAACCSVTRQPVATAPR